MAGELYEFGEFTLDASERRLSREGQVVSLEPKALGVFLALVRKAGRLVTKRELLELVWPESFVEEGILAVHISGLRKALGDDARRYIQTVPRSGYRFTGTVTQRDVDPSGSADRWCIAVLPAQPLTTEILGNGRELGLAIADSVIDRLGRFKQVVVRPTRAVHTYMNIRRDPAEVGRALHVDAVIDCHFVNAVDGVRVAAHLVRSWDGVRYGVASLANRPPPSPPSPAQSHNR